MISPVNSQNTMLNTMQQLQQIASAEQTVSPAKGGGISTDFAQLIQSVNHQQNLAAEMMAAVDAGRSDDVVGAMVASQKADLSFSMLLQIRNKVMNGIDDVMRMSL